MLHLFSNLLKSSEIFSNGTERCAGVPFAYALHSLHRGHKYASFRWVPSDLVKCHFSLEHFDSLFYGGQNFTDYVEGNRSEPSEAARKMLSWSKLGCLPLCVQLNQHEHLSIFVTSGAGFSLGVCFP